MSFYPQPNDYQCGPFALKYALAVLGIFQNEDQIGIGAGSTWWSGTDEIGLTKVVKKYRCDLKYFNHENFTSALKLLDKQLKSGSPCLLSVNNWGHWITVINHVKDKYIIVNSADQKVISVITKNKLKKLWQYYDEEEDFYSFDGYSLKPNFKIKTQAKMTLQQAKELMYKNNESLALNWDQYFNDVILICKPNLSNEKKQMSVKEFFRRNGKLLVNNVANWHGSPSYSELDKVLENIKFISSVYNLMIPFEHEKNVLVEFSSILMMYSCGKYGMDPIY